MKTVIYNISGKMQVAGVSLLLLLYSISSFGQMTYADSAAVRETYMEQKIEAAKTLAPGNFSLDNLNLFQTESGIQLGDATKAGDVTQAAAVSLPVTYQYYVATNGNDVGPGSYISPFRTIQNAINRASSGNAIKVADGYYPGSLEFNNKNIKLVGNPGDPTKVVINESSTNVPKSTIRMTGGQDGTTLLCGFTISGGNNTDTGLNGCGGGIFLRYASPVLSHLVIYHNYATTGGALAVTNYSKPVLQNTLVLNNSGAAGNYMIHIDPYCEATIRNVTIVDNYTARAAIGVTGGSQLTLTNSILSNPSLPYTVELQGTYNDRTTISYCNIRGAAADSHVYSLTMGNGNINVDPGFEPYSHLLASGSPCIDAGDPSPEWNDVNFPPSKGTVRNDMGAYGGPTSTRIGPTGDSRENPILIDMAPHTPFTNSQNTAVDFSNTYTGRPTNDVFYRFTLTRQMELEIKLCGSGIDTYLWLLDANGNGVTLDTDGKTVEPYNDNYTGAGQCANTTHSYMKRRLNSGNYYIVVEGNSQNGQILINTTCKYIMQGDTWQNPIPLGTFNNNFQKNVTERTLNYTNTYGLPTSEVFHQFTITKKMNITLSHCGSYLDTYMYLLDAAGNRIAENDNYSGVGKCSSTQHAYLRKNGLAPGTYCVVSEGVSADGTITLNVQGTEPVPSAVFGYPDAPDASSTDASPVGSVAGSMDVSPTGAATYSMPIACPMGVGGMQPNISLTYNSQSGNGIAGWGANISGISVITRGPKNIYHDVLAKPMTYAADDAYYLDGQRLIYSPGSGTEGLEGTIYYPESDPFTKVTVHGNYSFNSCTIWFEVTGKDGIKSHYGSSGGSRQQPSSGKVSAWYLDYVEDPLGNYMNYTYSSYSYCMCLNTVTYGKNKNESTSLENKIVLNYQARPDIIPFIIGGSKGSVNNRLASITSWTGTTKYREYTLEYTKPDHFSRLASVTEKNGSGESLKPTKFTWNSLPAFAQEGKLTTVNKAEVFPLVPFTDQTFQAADLNGDGIADLAGVFPIKIGQDTQTYLYIYYGSLDFYGNPQFLTGKFKKINTTFNDLRGWEEETGGCSPIDFDGDGTFELLMPHACIYEDNKFIEFWLHNNQPTSNWFTYNLQQSGEMPDYATGDIDNDGRGDVIIIEKGHNDNNYYPCFIAGFKLGTTMNVAQMNLYLPQKPEKIFVSDFNGNGLNDVMVFYQGGYTIFWNQGRGISPQSFSSSQKLTGTNIGDCFKISVGDFDGDGMMDFLMNATNSNQWHFALNNGNGMFTKQLACTLDIYDHDFTEKDNGKFDCHVFDFDYDGKTDVVITKAMYRKEKDLSGTWGEFLKTYTYWMRSTGSLLTQIAAATSNNEHDAVSGYYVTGDFNGDGRAELMNYGYNCYNGSGGSSRIWNLYKNPSLTTPSGMVTTITPGAGDYVKITYASLVGGGIYTKGKESSYPLIDITPAMPAVQTLVAENGVAGTMSTHYSYTGARVHLQGKGFLGMTSTKSENTTTGVTSESGILKLDPNYYVPSETYSKTWIGEDTAKTITKLTVINKGSKKLFVYPKEKIETDMDKNTYTTSYKFNETSGYMTEEKTVFGDTSMYKTQKYEDFILAGGSYKPRLITLIQKHGDDKQAFKQKSSLAYNTTKGYPVSKTENAGSAKPLTTEYTGYDNFGNCTSYRISGSGLATISYHNKYDATRRFITKAYTTPSTVVSTFTYDTWGNVLTETDSTNAASPLITSHTYNGWEQETSVTSPEGIYAASKTGWGNGTAGKCYFTLVQCMGQPWVKTWYDRVGRETMVESIGPDGISIATNHTYNYKGQLKQTENLTGDLAATETFAYDSRGRLESQSSTSGPIATYTYGKRTQTTTKNGQKYTQTFDAWGNVISSKDPVSSVSYTYYSVGQPKTMTSDNAIFSMTYDAAGNQSTLTDPDAGTTTYTYDAAGRIITQVDGKGVKLTNYYDGLNRLDSTTLGFTRTDLILTDYTYGVSGNELNRLTQIKTGNNYVAYKYDKYGRPNNEKRNVDGTGLLEFIYAYNSSGQLQKTTYPGGLNVSNEYDGYGNLVKVLAGTQTMWELTGATGTITTAKVGADMTTTTTRNAQGLITNLKTVKGSATVLRNFSYDFNATTGNLNWRTGMIAQKESFYYDNVDRLTTIKQGTPEVQAMSVGYEANGNILNKTNLGTYSYHSTKKHAVEKIENTGKLLNTRRQLITYNAFNKATRLVDTVNNTDGTTTKVELDIMYGPDQQRWRSVLKKNGSVAKTITFAGDYEQMIQNGAIWNMHYIYGGEGLAAIYVKRQWHEDRVYYPHTDHLGSIVKLTDAAGATVFSATYDAWGKKTPSKYDPFPFHRGFTGHEHLDEFGLINMNGRMYDPTVGRFLSPDPYVQAPDYSQSFNRYSYCLNNPLKYTDPSGELFGELVFIAAMTYIAGMQSNFMYSAQNGGNPFNPGDWNWKSPWTYTSMAAGAFSAYSLIGGLNGFKNVTANTGGVATSDEGFLKWLDAQEAMVDKGGPMSFGPGRAVYDAKDDSYRAYLREQIIYAKRSSHQRTMSSPVVQSIHQVHAEFMDHPFTQVFMMAIPTGGAIKGAFTGVKFLGKGAMKLFGGSVAKTGGKTFFEGAKYSDKVIRQMSKTDDILHAFPKSVDGYATKFGQWSTKIGADGKVYQWLEMPGSYGGKTGTFEFIKDANRIINHRFFNVP